MHASELEKTRMQMQVRDEDLGCELLLVMFESQSL